MIPWHPFCQRLHRPPGVRRKNFVPPRRPHAARGCPQAERSAGLAAGLIVPARTTPTTRRAHDVRFSNRLPHGQPRPRIGARPHRSAMIMVIRPFQGVQLPVHPWLVLTRRTPILDRLVMVMICTPAPAGRAEGRIARIACPGPGAIEGTISGSSPGLCPRTWRGWKRRPGCAASVTQHRSSPTRQAASDKHRPPSTFAVRLPPAAQTSLRLFPRQWPLRCARSAARRCG